MIFFSNRKKAVIERFHQIKPKLLFSVRAVSYNAKRHDHLGKLREVVDALDSLQKVVIVPFLDDELQSSLDGIKNA